jgi:hypothetical protein
MLPESIKTSLACIQVAVKDKETKSLASRSIGDFRSLALSEDKVWHTFLRRHFRKVPFSSLRFSG